MSSTDKHIRTCQNAVLHALKENPSKSLSTSRITGAVSDGLQCEVTKGPHSVAMDMRAAMGGTETAPSPSFFAEAGLVGCLAIATKMTAARLGLTVRAVQVEVEIDTDTLALFGEGGGNAAPLDTRIKIAIDSDETDDQINALMEHVLTIDTWFLALRDPQPVSIGWERRAQAA